MSLNVIIDDQQTTSDSLNATVNNKFKYPRIYYWVFMDFLKTSLTRSVFELETCSFFLNGSEFRQKLIGSIISAVFPTKWHMTRHFYWKLIFWLIGPSALPQCTVFIWSNFVDSICFVTLIWWGPLVPDSIARLNLR